MVSDSHLGRTDMGEDQKISTPGGSLFTNAVDRIARSIHERYRECHRGVKSPDDPSMKPWEDLLEDLKASNRSQAEQIPKKLRLIGYTFASTESPGTESVVFSREEIEVLSKDEHRRLVKERIEAGWTLGPRDPERRSSPYLVEWEDLTEEVREWDRQLMRAIPEIMMRAGFMICKTERPSE